MGSSDHIPGVISLYPAAVSSCRNQFWKEGRLLYKPVNKIAYSFCVSRDMAHKKHAQKSKEISSVLSNHLLEAISFELVDIFA